MKVPSNLGPLPCPSCERLQKECTRSGAEARDLRARLRVSEHWQDKLADRIFGDYATIARLTAELAAIAEHTCGTCEHAGPFSLRGDSICTGDEMAARAWERGVRHRYRVVLRDMSCPRWAKKEE